MKKNFSLALCIFASVSVTKAMDDQNVASSSLHKAADFGRLERVQSLLREGANVNLQDNNGNTPLIIATAFGHLEIVKALLLNGADVTKTNNTGFTALQLGAYRGMDGTSSDKGRNQYIDIIKILLKHMDVDQVNEEGRTPLHHAAAWGYSDVVQALLDNKADINRVDNSGQTPLHLAAQKGHQETVEILLHNMAAVNIADKSNKTPLYYAIENGHQAVKKVLLAAGAKNSNLPEDKSFLKLIFTAPLAPKLTGKILSAALEQHQKTARKTKLWALGWAGTAGIIATGLGYLISNKIHRSHVVPAVAGTLSTIATWIGLQYCPEVRKRRTQQSLLKKLMVCSPLYQEILTANLLRDYHSNYLKYKIFETLNFIWYPVDLKNPNDTSKAILQAYAESHIDTYKKCTAIHLTDSAQDIPKSLNQEYMAKLERIEKTTHDNSFVKSKRSCSDYFRSIDIYEEERLPLGNFTETMIKLTRIVAQEAS